MWNNPLLIAVDARVDTVCSTFLDNGNVIIQGVELLLRDFQVGVSFVLAVSFRNDIKTIKGALGRVFLTLAYLEKLHSNYPKLGWSLGIVLNKNHILGRVLRPHQSTVNIWAESVDGTVATQYFGRKKHNRYYALVNTPLETTKASSCLDPSSNH